MPKRKAIASREFEAPYVRVRGRVSRKGKVTWSPCLRSARFPAAFADPLPGASYRVVIEGRKGEELESARVDVQFVNVDPDWATFVARLPYRSEARAVALYQREKKLGALAVPKDEPKFHLLHPLGSREIDPEACLHLRWKSVSKTPLTYHVRFTADEKKWFRLAVNLQQDDYVLDLRTLPGGRRWMTFSARAM